MKEREHGSPSPGIKPVLSGSGTNPCGSCMQLNVQRLHGAERIPVEGYPHVSDLLARASAGLVPVGINPQKRTRLYRCHAITTGQPHPSAHLLIFVPHPCRVADRQRPRTSISVPPAVRWVYAATFSCAKPWKHATAAAASRRVKCREAPCQIGHACIAPSWY